MTGGGDADEDGDGADRDRPTGRRTEQRRPQQAVAAALLAARMATGREQQMLAGRKHYPNPNPCSNRTLLTLEIWEDRIICPLRDRTYTYIYGPTIVMGLHILNIYNSYVGLALRADKMMVVMTKYVA